MNYEGFFIFLPPHQDLEVEDVMAVSCEPISKLWLLYGSLHHQK